MQAELNFLNSFQKAVRLIPLRGIPTETKYVRDEMDFVEALDTIVIFLEATRGMIGKQKYQRRKYNPLQEVKLDLQEMYLRAKEPVDSALKRKKHAVLYYYVLEPVVDMMQGMSHEEALNSVQAIVERAKDLIMNHNVKQDLQDALVMKEIVRHELQNR